VALLIDKVLPDFDALIYWRDKALRLNFYSYIFSFNGLLDWVPRADLTLSNLLVPTELTVERLELI
jgi:hypothetical protein